MKVLLYTILLCLSQPLFSQQINVISPNLTGDELLTGSEFTLDAVLQVPPGCSYATISINLPAWISLGTNQPIQSDAMWSCATSNCNGTAPYTLQIESLPNAFANGGAGDGSDGVNFQLNLKMGMGYLCEGEQFDFQFEMEYFEEDANGLLVSCGSGMTDVATIYSKYLDDYWNTIIIRETPDSLICTGGYIKYKIVLPYKNTPGGYNLSNTSIISAGLGQVHALYDANYNEIPYSLLFGYQDCNPIPFWGLSHNVFQSEKIFYLIRHLVCGICDYELEYSDAVTGIQINKPCETNGDIEGADINEIDSTLFQNICCGSYSVPANFAKYLSYGNRIENLCPGSCHPITYGVQLNNTLSPDAIFPLVITDEIPDNFDVEYFSFSATFDTYFSSGKSASLWFDDGTGFQSRVLIPGSTSPNTLDPNQNITLATLGITDVTEIQLALSDPLDAFSGYIHFTYRGTFNDDTNVGDVVTPCAQALGTTIPPACLETTLPACDDRISARSWAFKPTIDRTTSLKVNRGEKATIQLVVSNDGTADLIDADLTMTLPSDFTYCANTARFYYHTSSDPSGQSSSLTPASTVGGTFTASGQNISLTDFNLDKLCDQGKYLIIELDVVTSEDAIAGPNFINYMVNGITSGSANLTVNSFYQVEANMYVSCEPLDCSENTSTTAYVAPGDIIYFKMEIENKGNVVLDGVKLYNNIPQINDQNSVCDANRNSEFQITYSPAVVVSCTFDSDEQYGNNSSGTCPSSYPNTWTSASQSAEFLSSDLFNPGDKYSVVYKATVLASTAFGLVSKNDFSFDLIRSDVAGRTEKQLSNEVNIYSAPTECGEYTDITDISCTNIMLSMTSDTIPNVDSCCLTISITNPYFGTIQGIHVNNITGEYFDNIEVQSGFMLDIPNNGHDLYFYTQDSSNLAVGTYDIVTVCYDPLYSSTQLIESSIQMDTVGTSNPQVLCVSQYTGICPVDNDLDYWTKIYNSPNAQSDYGRVIKVFDNHIYICGYTFINGTYSPFISKFNLSGDMIWQVEYPNMSSIFEDFVLSHDNTKIIAVGRTLPHNTSNKSIVANIDNITGHLILLKEHDNSGREQLLDIILHPNPTNSSYPYYVFGLVDGQDDRVIVMNINADFNINWESKYHKGDDQLNVMFPLDDGDIVIAGEIASDHYGHLLKLDGGDGTILDADSMDDKWSYITSGIDVGSGIVVIGQRFDLEEGFIALHDYDFERIDAIKLTDVNKFGGLVYGSNDTIYTIGLRNIVDGGGGDQSKPGGSNRAAEEDLEGVENSLLMASKYPVISRWIIDDSGATADLQYVDSYKFETGNQSFAGQHIYSDGSDAIYFSSTQQDYTGDWKIKMGTLPLTLENSNCLESYTANPFFYNYNVSSAAFSKLNFTFPSDLKYYNYSDIDYTCIDQCNPDCLSDFDWILSYSANECGVIATFNNTSTALSGPYNWTFGDGTSAINVENPVHLFDTPGTYNVCLHALDCPDTKCQPVLINFDTKLPSLTCPPVGVFCAITDSCYAYVTLPNIMLSGGNVNCVDTTIIRTDGTALDDPYYIGNTTVMVTITNEFGASASCTMTVIVNDCQYPEITCPENICVNASYNETAAIVNWEEPVKEFYCNKVITTQSHYSGDQFPCGITTVTYTIDELNGQTATCSFDVEVKCDTITNRCGEAAFTCFPGFISNQPASGIDMNKPVYGISNIKNRTGVSPGYWAAQSGANIHHPSHWNATNLGLIFGMTIDEEDYTYLTATTVYGCNNPGIFDAFTSAGASGIHKVSSSSAGTITNIVTTGPFVSGGTTIPNNGGGLGNICHNNVHDLLYVTNVSDGKIYTIDGATDQVLYQYDPFATTTPNSNTFADLGDRPWGVAYNKNDNKLYYSNWIEDRGRINLTENNKIYSVDLDANGYIITSTEMEILEMPDHLDQYDQTTYNQYSNPVSDIAFGDNGLMLISERSMFSDCGDAARAQSSSTSKYAHNSRVLEYEDQCGVWKLTNGHGTTPFSNYATDLKYLIGSASGGNLGTNSSGGVDFGYSNIISTSNDFNCDEMVWSTADFMLDCARFRWYGIEGIPSTGGDECDNAFLIDFDGINSSSSKIMQGDVEVFKCLECEAETNTCCTDFNDQYIGAWSTIASTITRQSPGPSLDPDDYYLRVKDGSGSSWIYNDIDYDTNFENFDGACLCWDFKVFNDGSPSALNVNPVLRIYQGSPTSPTLEAQFISNLFMTEVQNWLNVCAPIETAITSLPSNALGSWIMTTGSGVADWNNLIADVDGIRYYVDLTSSPTEIFGFDNICMADCGMNLDILVCPDLETNGSLSHLVLPPENPCCFRYDIDLPSDTQQDEMTFRILTPGVEFGSFTPDGSTNNNYPNPSKKKGAIQEDGIVDYCLIADGGTFPSEISMLISSIHYLQDGSQYVLCSDTITTPCGSPTPFDGCYEVVDSMVTCATVPFTTNGNYEGYEIKLKIDNQSNQNFGSLSLTFDESSNFFWNPTVYGAFDGDTLAPGMISDWMIFHLSPDHYISDTTEVCFDIHPINEAGNFCCNEIESYCLELIPCCVAEDSTIVISTEVPPSPSGNCCVEIGFENSCAFDYFKYIEAEILTEGVTVGSHSDLTEDWYTVGVSDTELHYYPSNEYIPTGSSEDLYALCLNNINTSSQTPKEIEFRWITCDTIIGEQVVYRDTLTLNCMPIIQDQCFSITDDSIRCSVINDIYYYDYTLNNTSGHDINQIAIIPVNGTSASSYYPQSVNTSVANGSTYSGSIELFGDVDDEVDFRFRIFDNDDNFCCYQQDTVQLTIQNCCAEILVINMDPVIAGDYYASQKITLMKDVGQNVNLNLYTPLAIVESTVITEAGAMVNVQPKNCGGPTSLNFDGTNDFVDIDPLLMNFDATISGWFKLDESNIDGAANRILSVFQPGHQKMEFGVSVIESGSFVGENRFWIYEEWNGTVTLGPDLNDGEWHHYAYVREGTDRRVYLDGELLTTFYSGTTDWGDNLYIGRCACGGTGHYWNGDMDDFYIFDEAKSESFITDSLYCKDFTNPEDALVYYDFDGASPFDDNTGLLLLEDQSSNGINGELKSFALTGTSSNYADNFGGPQDLCCSTPPIASCYTLVVEIEASLTVTINASDLNDSSSAPCGGALTYSFSADPSDNTATFDCSHVDVFTPITLWVTDEYGNQSTCLGQVLVQDPNGFCQ